MGKGTIGINPFHTDRSLMSPVAVAGLLATIVAFTDSGARESNRSLSPSLPLTASLYSHPRQVSLDALLYRHGHVPRAFSSSSFLATGPDRLNLAALPHHVRRGRQPSPRHRSRWTGAYFTRLSFSRASQLTFSRSRRPLTSSDKLESPERSLASRRTRLPCGSARWSAPSSRRRSTCRTRTCSRAVSCSFRCCRQERFR